MAEGASLADPSRIDVRGNLSVGEDVFIDINCVFIGEVTIADDVSIGPNCVIENSTIGCGSVIKANCVLDDAEVGISCDIGPYARLRPGTVLSAKAKIGNFVDGLYLISPLNKWEVALELVKEVRKGNYKGSGRHHQLALSEEGQA